MTMRAIVHTAPPPSPRVLMVRSSHLALVAALLLSVFPLPVRALAGPTSCLTGTAPEVATDPNDIRDARAAVDAACPCSQFDGSDGHAHGDYAACVKTALAQPGIVLRKSCL